MGLLTIELLPSCMLFIIFLHNLVARIEKKKKKISSSNTDLAHRTRQEMQKYTKLVNINIFLFSRYKEDIFCFLKNQSDYLNKSFYIKTIVTAGDTLIQRLCSFQHLPGSVDISQKSEDKPRNGLYKD